MNKIPLVSVIIPAFNSAELISETITSVLCQDFTEFEIIIIDDGSTDDTSTILSKYENRIRYFKKTNGGQASARNLGIKEARGKYVAFLDSDDLWVKEKLKRQVDALEKSAFKWIYSDAYAFDHVSGINLYLFSEQQNQPSGDILRSLFKSCFIPSPTPMVEKQVFSDVGFFDESQEMRNREDWDMWLRIAAKYPIAHIPEPLARYRLHQKSATGSEKRISAMKGYEITLKKALNREPEKLKSLYNSVLSGFYFRESRYQAYNKNLKAAKEFLKASISLTPLKISLYLFWLLLPVAHQIYSILKKK